MYRSDATMQPRWLLAFAATIVLALASLAVMAQPMGMGGHGRGLHHPPGMFCDQALKQLDLTDQQRDALKGVMDANRDAMRNRMEEMIKARRALRDAVHSATYDEQAIRRAASEVGRVETDSALARAQLRQQLRQILTPEQFGELEGMHKAMRMHRFERRHDDRGWYGRGGSGMGPGPDGAPPRP